MNIVNRSSWADNNHDSPTSSKNSFCFTSFLQKNWRNRKLVITEFHDCSKTKPSGANSKWGLWTFQAKQTSMQKALVLKAAQIQSAHLKNWPTVYWFGSRWQRCRGRHGQNWPQNGRAARDRCCCPRGEGSWAGGAEGGDASSADPAYGGSRCGKWNNGLNCWRKNSIIIEKSWSNKLKKTNSTTHETHPIL